jgi:hypothetical protein
MLYSRKLVNTPQADRSCATRQINFVLSAPHNSDDKMQVVASVRSRSVTTRASSTGSTTPFATRQCTHAVMSGSHAVRLVSAQKHNPQDSSAQPISTLLNIPKTCRPTSSPIGSVTLGAVNLTGVSRNEMPNIIPAHRKHDATSSITGCTRKHSPGEVRRSITCASICSSSTNWSGMSTRANLSPL